MLKSPMVWFTGWALIVIAIAAFFVSIILAVNATSSERRCLSAGGSWSYTLAEPESDHNQAQYDEKCTRGK